MRLEECSNDFKTFNEWFFYERETGLLWWKKKRVRHTDLFKPINYLNPNGYKYLVFNKKRYLQHRVIWLMTQGSWPKYQIDHINCNKTDNRLENLRDVHQSVNQANQPVRRGKRLVGTQFLKATRKWVAVITRNRKHYQLGSFDTELQAHERYLKEKLKFKEMCHDVPSNKIPKATL